MSNEDVPVKDIKNATKKMKLAREEKFIHFYCREGSPSYLDHVEAYRMSGASLRIRTELIVYHARRMLNKPHVREKIKALLPSIAFNYLFIRTEMLDLYNIAKKEGNLRVCQSLLQDMSKIEGMYIKSDKVDASDDESQQKEAHKMWLEQSAKMKELAGRASGEQVQEEYSQSYIDMVTTKVK